MANSGVDLNKLREMVIANQEHGQSLPTHHTDKVFVDRNGAIKPGTEVSPEEGRQLSEVHQAVFALIPHLSRQPFLPAR